jgi:membrane-bound serine protease (ClpP class)
VIGDPGIAYILMLLGIYGLIYEFSNPGMLFPGVVGGICLLLALFALQVMPINYVGLALIILGIVLMISEAFIPSFGALGIWAARRLRHRLGDADRHRRSRLRHPLAC